MQNAFIDEITKSFLHENQIPIFVSNKSQTRKQIDAHAKQQLQPQPAPAPQAPQAPQAPPPQVAGQQAVGMPYIVSGTIRSGQQIYARGQDLVVMGNVHSGAEALSDGNIYIFGVLKGRALCGVSGNRNSCLFATRFGGELVSIADVYTTFDGEDDAVRVRCTSQCTRSFTRVHSMCSFCASRFVRACALNLESGSTNMRVAQSRNRQACYLKSSRPSACLIFESHSRSIEFHRNENRKK
jgi:septum site-determining protein MinC